MMAARTPLTRQTWVDTGVLGLLTALGILGFAPIYGDLGFLVAGVGGILVGSGAGLLAAWLRWGPLLTAAVAVGAYALFGSALAMPAQALAVVIPTGETLTGLTVGALYGWADLVTLSTPVGAPDYLAVVTYVAGWVAGLASATFAARLYGARPRTPLMSLLGLALPVLVYVASVILGTSEPFFAPIRGIAFAAIALVWVAWRPVTASAVSARGTRRRVAGIAMVLAGATGVALLTGVVAAPPADDRFVLREEIVPPFDPLLYPSPLSGFRAYTKDLIDETLFTVSGLPEGTRVRIATMDAYDGVVWNVTGPDQYRDGSGSFVLEGRRTEVPTWLEVDGSDTIEVTIGAYHDVWIPGVGYPTSIEFSDAVPATAIRHNAQTGIAVLLDGFEEGMHYTLSAELPATISDAELAQLGVADVELPPVNNVPDIVAAKAVELAGDAATPIEKLRAIEAALHDLGFLSHGSATDAVPSSAGHGADRMKLLLEKSQWIGDDEQFASVFALMARSLGYPARVVLGFAPEGSGEQQDVTGADVSAWVEVAFDSVGWVPFFPTPDETDIPLDQAPKPKTEPQPQVRQPPRTDVPQDELVSPVELADDNEDPTVFVIPGWVWTVAAVVAAPFLLYFVPVLVIAFLKRRRRVRRREDGEPDRRAAGAWDELVDGYAELGYAAPRRTTRVQLALSFEDQFREELELRRQERLDARARAEARNERDRRREDARRSDPSAEPQPTAVTTRIGAAIDATVLRARETASWRPGVDDVDAPLPAIPGLRDFAVRADETAFSGRPISDADIGALWAELERAEAAARESVSWFRRQLSRFRLRSRRDWVATLTAQIESATDRATRGVRR